MEKPPTFTEIEKAAKVRYMSRTAEPVTVTIRSRNKKKKIHATHLTKLRKGRSTAQGLNLLDYDSPCQQLSMTQVGLSGRIQP